VVTSPSKAGQGVRNKTSSGTFAFVRPHQFRFDYQKPFAQTIVADGQTLWLYDVDLEQVSARKQSQTLSTTPAALIATATDVSALQKDFTLQAQPDADGLQWVQATPKNKESTLSQIRVGLRVEGAQVTLSKLDIADAMGQRSVISFERFEINPQALSAAMFQFTPPKGVDVVRP
jgi:outer membrane lipoprotein carrier protein